MKRIPEVRSQASDAAPDPQHESETRRGRDPEIQRLAETCAGLLEDAQILLRGLPDEVYRASLLGVDGGIGAQIRHCIDCSARLIAGIELGHVDYDRRQRDPRVTVDRRAALARLEELAAELRRRVGCAADRRLSVRQDEPDRGEDEGWVDSTLARELRFVASHLVHHFAIVALLLQSQGMNCPKEFGVAPATLGFRRRSA